MTTEEKLQLWIDITGVNPKEEKKSWTISLSGKLSDWDIKEMNDKLMEVVKHDLNGVFTNIFLKNYFDAFLKGKSLAFFDYITDESKYTDFISKCKQLLQAVNENSDIEKEIMEDTQKMISYYGIKDKKLDVFNISYLRISAEENINNLNVVQFKKGTGSKNKPKYVRDVYMMSNLDQLVRAAESGNFDGISVNYICDPESPESSYFAFLIKNGQNVYLMSDRPSYKHPNQKFMRRCPGRQMSDRIDKTYFPYSLTSVNIQDRYNVKDDNANALVESDYVKIGTLGDMITEEALWTINMFSLIEKKFFEQVYECEQLSYVGGMIKHPLLTENANSLVLYSSYDEINLPYIEHPEEIALDYDYKTLGIFNNTINRLKDKVDLTTVNAIGNTDQLLLENKNSFHESRRNMLSLNRNDFGTKEELEYKQKWIARFNFAEQINRLAKEEYDARHEEIKRWYLDALWKNIDKILDMVIFDQLKGTTIVNRHIGYSQHENVKSIVKKFTYKEYNDKKYWGSNQVHQSNYNKDVCIFTGSVPNLVICIFPNNIEDLMLLTGCSKEELPDVLQDWTGSEKDCPGNQILDNIDPCDWVIKDYWYRAIGQVDIFLSKTAYNDQYKKRGLTPDKFWLKSEEK